MKKSGLIDGRMKHVSLAGLFLLLTGLILPPSSEVFAQRGKISGKVIEKKTGQVLPGVNVVILGTTLGAATDLEGDYVIANLSPGTYTVKASMVGFRDVTMTDLPVHVNATTELNFELEEVVIELGNEVVITARRPLVEKDNTASRVFVETKEIAVRPTTEISQVLTSLPGINVEDGVMRFRGGTLDEVSFLVDGARLRNPLDQTPYMGVNLSAIHEVEVITGSFNAEYGEAQSGVVNVITKEGGDAYHFFLDQRYIPPGKKHWGPSLYDRNSEFWWENKHARHLQWWVDNPDQWVDPNNVPGNDPNSVWSPEQAYENYIALHSPLSDYTKIAGYQTEATLGGPVPFFNHLGFFLSGRYRSVAPMYGNSYRKRGTFINGTIKLTYSINPGMRIQFSGSYGEDKTSWGMTERPDDFYLKLAGYTGRFAYFDFPGLPESRTDAQTLRCSHALDQSTMYEIKLSRVFALRRVDALPDDPRGWEASDAFRYNLLRPVDENGKRLAYFTDEGYPVGFNTLGYYFRNDDKNTDWTLTGFYSNQFTKNWQLKSGFEFSYYNLDHYNESKAPQSFDDRVYNPYQGAAYVQNKLEFQGFIVNLGLRYDFYNPNDTVYSDMLYPFSGPKAKTETFAQLSPRIGIAHPIDDRTVLHFSYGHFFQRGPFGDYGEGFSEGQQRGSLTTFLFAGGDPRTLGNRNVKPQKTVAYEIGLERNIADEFILNLTAYYKDITNRIRGNIVVTNLQGVSYNTNGNADYGDVKGFEFSLRKTARGLYWGYVNFSTQIGIFGQSGDPRGITETRTGIILRSGRSEDFIDYDNYRLKTGFFLQTPFNWEFAGGALSDIILSFEYQVTFPNSKIPFNEFIYSDSLFSGRELQPADKNANLKLSKAISIIDNRLRLNAYVEVQNLFNDKWLNLSAFAQTPLAAQREFVRSGLKTLPSEDSNGVPLVETLKWRNLPRSIQFGLSMEF